MAIEIRVRREDLFRGYWPRRNVALFRGFGSLADCPMNKAVPWNVNGVGFDAREAAREAARRQGKSLGEWLHGVIADHAAGIGVEANNMSGRDRVDAVTSKLEKLGSRSADLDQRLQAARTDNSPKSRRDKMREREDTDFENFVRDDRNPSVGDHRAHSETSDRILEDAIEALQRRASRAEQRADEAMQSVNELLKRNEARRDHERRSVADFAQKLSEIETRLTNGFAQAEDNPIKGALAKLEARLDRIGRRDSAEAAVRPQAVVVEPQPAPEPLQRLEEKLNAILNVVQGRQALSNGDASPVAIAAVQTQRHQDRRLGEAIADIAKRQQALEGRSTTPVPLHGVADGRQKSPAERRFEETLPVPTAFAAMQSEISSLASKIEVLHRDFADQPRDAQPRIDLDGLRFEIATMSDMLRDLAPEGRFAQLEGTVRELTQRVESSLDFTRRETSLARSLLDDKETAAKRLGPSDVDRIQDQMRDIRDLVEASLSRPIGVEKIEGQIAALSDKLERLPETLVTEQFDSRIHDDPTRADEPTTLEILVRDLGRKMEAAQAPDASHQSFDALQDQIAALASRFEQSNEGLNKLAFLEKSMRDLFAHLDETRATVESSAARAARQALQTAMEEGRARSEEGAASGLAAMQALQDEAEARTKSTLTAVHNTLEKVVDRLAIMETEIAAGQNRKAVDDSAERPETAARSAEVARAKPSAFSLGGADPFLDQVLGRGAPQTFRKKTDAANPAQRDVGGELDAEAGRADFIAAARRAAKAAQSEAAAVDFRPSAASRINNPVRASLVTQSRDYVARHKRPVLLSIAALFVIVGTMAVMQRIGLGGSDQQVADAPAPSAVSRMISGEPTYPRSARLAELTPSTAPKAAPPLANPIPGSDPIQTGSIPSLPAFAQARTASAPRPSLPSGLRSMANAGDGGAQYMIATQLAEGRLVPRDYKQAAGWYQKAADQGIVPAQYRLASLYEKGLGVPQDKAKAKGLYTRAAEAGNPRAMHNLAVLLADGDGKPDYESAATWFRKAAQYGIHDSQYNLAILLARGLGTRQSFVQSYQWFAIAAAQNDSDAEKKRDEVGTKLSADDLAVAKALAASFRPRTADLAATDVQPPSGGWDGASAPAPLNTARAKISSL